MKERLKSIFAQVKRWLQSLSFRTGVIVLACCVPFYILSFAQMLLPISATAKGVLWTVLFGLAKTCQYGDHPGRRGLQAREELAASSPRQFG